mmetsp:Transcript_14967/g.33769  ORF Transcript_14967/g.33769 Transcript_14967/m.33769 type:complete len:97 (+) Transcript_14967:68-358(+)
MAAWTMAYLDGDVGPRGHELIRHQPAAVDNKNAFLNYIMSQNVHPRQAAQDLGRDYRYEHLGNNHYSIRLSQEHRMYFHVCDEARQVVINQFGGHR